MKEKSKLDELMAKGIEDRRIKFKQYLKDFRPRALEAGLPEEEIEELIERMTKKGGRVGVSCFRHADYFGPRMAYVNTFVPDGTISDEAFKLMYPMDGVKQYSW